MQQGGRGMIAKEGKVLGGREMNKNGNKCCKSPKLQKRGIDQYGNGEGKG
jgi:hypothetical protein